MLRPKAFKFRICPNVKQRLWPARPFGCARFACNHSLRRRMDCYAAHQGEKQQGSSSSDTARALVSDRCLPGDG
jgi:transposase